MSNLGQQRRFVPLLLADDYQSVPPLPPGDGDGDGDVPAVVDLCAVQLDDGGGDTFDCYEDMDPAADLNSGSEFDGAWILGPSEYGFRGNETFDKYDDNDSVETETLNLGDDFDGAWISGESEYGFRGNETFDHYDDSAAVETTTLNLADDFDGAWIFAERTWAATDVQPTWWLEADHISGLVDGNTIITWEDKSKSANLVQAGGNRPSYRTNVVNGLPVVRFASTNWMGQSGFMGMTRAIGAASVVHVFKFSNITNSGADRMMLNLRGAAGTNRIYIAPYTADPAFKFRILGRRLDTDANAWVLAPMGPDLDWHVMVNVFDWQNTTVQCWMDGVKVAEDTSWLTAGVTSATDSVETFVGSSGANAGFQGDLAALMLFRHAFTADEAVAVSQHFKTKYGL